VGTFFEQEKGFSDADVRTFLCTKFRIFRNLLCVRADKGGEGLSQCGHFSDKGEGGGDFVRTSCMDGSLL